MTTPALSVYRLSDGSVECSTGHRGVKMLARSGYLDSGESYFRYRPVSFKDDIMVVSWFPDEPFQLLPYDVASYLLLNRYARHPSDEELAALQVELARPLPPPDGKDQTPPPAPAAAPPAPAAPATVQSDPPAATPAPAAPQAPPWVPPASGPNPKPRKGD